MVKDHENPLSRIAKEDYDQKASRQSGQSQKRKFGYISWRNKSPVYITSTDMVPPSESIVMQENLNQLRTRKKSLNWVKPNIEDEGGILSKIKWTWLKSPINNKFTSPNSEIKDSRACQTFSYSLMSKEL